MAFTGLNYDPNYTDVVAMNEPMLNLHRQREPRFYANIAADRCYWRLGTSENNNYLVKTYQGEDFGLQETRLNALTAQNITGYYLKKWGSSDGNLYAHQSGLSSFGESPFPMFRLAEAQKNDFSASLRIRLWKSRSKTKLKP